MDTVLKAQANLNRQQAVDNNWTQVKRAKTRLGKAVHAVEVLESDAAIAAAKAKLVEFEVAFAADNTRVFGWNDAHDNLRNAEAARHMIDVFWARRDWGTQDYAFAALVAANCD